LLTNSKYSIFESETTTKLKDNNMKDLIATIKMNYKVALTLGMSRTEAREMVIETLQEMGVNVSIAEEIING
jgi:biotin operon repressor